MSLVSPPPAPDEVTEPRGPLDEDLTAADHRVISLFRDLEKGFPFDKNPGTSLLRFKAKNTSICLQGDPGGTAYYILTPGDLVALRENQLAAAKAKGVGGENGLEAVDDANRRQAERITLIELQLEAAKSKCDAHKETEMAPARVVATAYLLPGGRAIKPRSWLASLFSSFTSSARLAPRLRRMIPADQPIDFEVASDASGQTHTELLQAPIHEGEVFGEMSCFNRAPRSATVIADEDCYVLEMTRNVLDWIHKESNPERRRHLDIIYRQRVLDLHLRNTELFDGLTTEQMHRLKHEVELVEFAPGTVLFEEHEPSDCCYLIRSGMVKVVTGLSPTPRLEEFMPENWRSCVDMWKPPSQSTGLLKLFWEEFERTRQRQAGSVETLHSLPEIESAAIAAAERATVPTTGKTDDSARSSDLPTDGDWQHAILASLRWFVHHGKLHVKQKSDKAGAPMGSSRQALIEALQSAEFATRSRGMADDPELWSDIEARVFHRFVLEKMLGPGMPRMSASSMSSRTLAYRGRGEVIGELSMFLDRNRTATCIAYDHPDIDIYQENIPDSRTGAVLSRLEAVRIDRELFRSLLSESEPFRNRIRSLVEERTGGPTAAGAAQASDQKRPGIIDEEEFQDLGLYQGQKMMLIDLDRCTRCGNCVDACVKSHSDGHTRLFLDGPRIDRYLVPLSCRKCHDPVCMIGCPVGSIVRGENGEIEIKDWCTACGACASQCPYGSIQIADLPHRLSVEDLSERQRRSLPEGVGLKPVDQRAVVCDLCSSLPSREPACVYACPHDAALRVNGIDFFTDFRRDVPTTP